MSGTRSTMAAARAAWWAMRTLRVVRRRVGGGRLEELTLPSPPALPPTAERGVRTALRGARATCLEEALVRQRWDAAHGRLRDVVVGVSAPSAFRAHAWLDGEAPPAAAGFHELTRIGP